MNAAQRSGVVEIRSYDLKADAGAEFHRLMSDHAIPMPQRWQVDVVALGPSFQERYE